MARATLFRKVTFSAVHRYWSELLTPEENIALFGQWASRYNHGHNYAVWVGVSGDVDKSTGMVVNIKDIDAILQQSVVKRFDQKSLNDEAMVGKVPCLETLLCEVAGSLTGLPDGIQLESVKIIELPGFYGEWSQGVLTLTRTYEFAAAHRLASPDLSDEENFALYGKCTNANGHGHNYVLEVTVTGDTDPSTGFLCDISALDQVVEREVVSRYDHKNLDKDVPELQGKTTTSENVAIAIFSLLKDRLPAELKRIKLFETARNAFEVEA